MTWTNTTLVTGRIGHPEPGDQVHVNGAWRTIDTISVGYPDRYVTCTDGTVIPEASIGAGHPWRTAHTAAVAEVRAVDPDATARPTRRGEWAS